MYYGSMKLDMVYYPAPSLRELSAPVREITSEVREAVPQMFELMYKNRGIGLAGPQAGFNFRLIVANIKGEKEKGEELVFINPEIVLRDGVMLEDEGCLSLPGFSVRIRRSARVRVRYTLLDGKAEEVEAEGIWAKLFQHEIDHLDGILMIDKMTAADLKQWKPLLKELEEDYAAKEPPRRRKVRRTAEAGL